MQTNDKSGVICDGCGSICVGNFQYYSVTVKTASVQNNRKPVETLSKSHDICEACYADVTAKVLQYYQPTKRLPDGSRPNGIVCDLTGVNMSGTFKYHRCIFDFVSVRLDVKPPVVSVDKERLELEISEQALSGLIKDTQWSTSST